MVIGVYGVQHAKNFGELKAISQNMGHDSFEVTDQLYGELANDDVKDIITGFSQDEVSEADEKLYREFLAFKKWMRDSES